MSDEMRVLLETLINSTRAQLDTLSIQIRNYEDLLYPEEKQRAIDQSDFRVR